MKTYIALFRGINVGGKNMLPMKDLAATLANPASAAPNSRIDVLVFNVLAPVWVGAEWYPSDMDPALLDTQWRRERITNFLRERAATPTSRRCRRSRKRAREPNSIT